MQYSNGKRDDIINAAIKLFGKNGFEATSTMDIVRMAGASKGLMYHYFSSKEELIEVAFQKCHRAFEDGVMRDVDEREDVLERLYLRCRNIIAWARENGEMNAVNDLYFSQPKLRFKLSMGYQQSGLHFKAIDRLIREGVENGRLKNVDPLLLGEIYYNICGALYCYAMTTGVDMTSEGFWQTIRSVITDAMAAKP